MKEEEIKELFEQFEAIANEYEGVECWSARELAQVLGYSQWRNFEGIIEKAKASCTNAGQEVSYHFADVSKMVTLGSGSQREVKDYMLTRYACYLIAPKRTAKRNNIYHNSITREEARISLHISRPTLAQQLLCKRTSPDVQAHNSCCAVVETNSSGNYSYIFQQLPLYVSKTSVIPFRYFSYIFR